MKRKYWWIFGVVQVMGALASVECAYLGALSAFFALLPMLLLLPGSLAWIPVMDTQFFGTGLSFVFGEMVIAITANVTLFAIASFLVGRLSEHRKLRN
jgi:hypothetical protein